MPSPVLAVVIGLLISSPALPQCNFTPVLSDPFRSSILDLAIDGNDLWAATSYGLALFDRSVDPPRLTATLAVPGTTRVIRLGNSLVYAGSGNSIAVVRKNGRALQLVRMVDAGAPVNDLLVTTLAIFVATKNGVAQYSLVDPTNPASPLAVSNAATSSLALMGSTLYAAESSRVSLFTISPTVQPSGAISPPTTVTAVHANNGKVFISTPIDTHVFIGLTEAGSVPFSLISIAPISGDAVFAASTDRTLRAINFTAPGTPIDLFRDDLPPSGGNINRVTSLAIAGGRAYVGAGDIGLLDYDISAFSAPFPLRSAPFSRGASSVVSLGDNFYVGTPHGVTEFNQNLIQKRSWDGDEAAVVQDGSGNFLLTSSGTTLTLWVLDSLGKVGRISFANTVRRAALFGTVGWAALSDGLLWFSDLGQQEPAPQSQATPATSIARSGRAVAFALNSPDGTTSVTYGPDLAASAGLQISQVQGLNTVPVTVSGAVAAVQTFRGISLIDFGTDPPSTIVLPQSNDVIARQLLLSGTTLLELTDSTLRVWNTVSKKITSEVTLPDSPIAMSIAPQSTIVNVVTSSGVITVALDRLSRMPSAIATPNGNAFYKKVIASSNRIGLIDALGVDLFTSTMQYAGSIRAGGIIDVAASDNGFYTLSGNLTVAAYSPIGIQQATATISEGSDAQALSIATVNGAVWVSIIHGCTSGACEKKTLIFNNKLSQTISLSGGIIDVVPSGNRAYAITDLPAEIRVINVADPLHPSITASRSANGNSIAYWNGTIYVLGDGLASYNEISLTKTADLLTATSNPDEHIRIDGNCAIVTGRDSSPQLFTLPQFTQADSFGTPSTARTVAAQPGVFYVLTDHSLEIWSTTPLPKPPRRAPAR